MSRRTGKSQLNRCLCPSFTYQSMRKKFVEHSENVLKKHVQLFTTANGPYFGRYIFIMPERLITPKLTENQLIIITNQISLVQAESLRKKLIFYLEEIKSIRDLTISLMVTFGVGGFSWSIPNITVDASSSKNNVLYDDS